MDRFVDPLVVVYSVGIAVSLVPPTGGAAAWL
jgi:hypothetical protein